MEDREDKGNEPLWLVPLLHFYDSRGFALQDWFGGAWGRGAERELAPSGIRYGSERP